MPFEFGDVVLVPFPFTSQAASKQRPAVIVSNLAYNRVKPVFATLQQTLIIRKLGTLATADQAALKNAIAQVLA